MNLKQAFEIFETEFLKNNLHKKLDMDEAVQLAFSSGLEVANGLYMEKNSMWLKEKTEKVSALIALEELTRPFPKDLTLDDLSEHNKMIRKKYNLDKLPKEEK